MERAKKRPTKRHIKGETYRSREREERLGDSDIRQMRWNNRGRESRSE